jgi:hypothetical protein
MGSWAAAFSWVRERKYDIVEKAKNLPLIQSLHAADNAFSEASYRIDELRRHLAEQEAAHLEVVSQGDLEEQIARQRAREWTLFALGALASVPVGIFVNWIS